MEWMYNINIKSDFTDNSDEKVIALLCDKLIVQLNKIKNKLSNSLIKSDYKIHFEDKLADIIDNLEFLSMLAKEVIPKSEWSEHSFDGNFQSLFNDYMVEIYDLGDSKFTIKNTEYKFIWVK